jgi:hypothetical protein
MGAGGAREGGDGQPGIVISGIVRSTARFDRVP